MKKWTSCFVVLGVLASSVPDASALTVPAGTKVLVKTVEVVSSAVQKKGDTINMVAAADVVVNGQKVIAAGAPALALVQNASKRFIAGIGGQLDIQVQKVQATDGTWIPLEYVKGEHSGSSLVSVVLTVVCCICFIFIPGKDVSIEKGTIFESTVVSPAEVR